MAFLPMLRRVAWLVVFLSIGVATNAAGGDDGLVEVIYVGDIMVDDLPGKFIEQGNDPFAEFQELFDSADLVVGNLECVVGTKGQPEDKPWTFQAHPRVVPILARHFDALSVANNHTGDYGKEAFLETLDLLKGKVPVFGGGKNLTEARTPLLVEKKGIKFALLGYNEFKPRSFAATDDTPGCAWAVDEHVLADIKTSREKHGAQIVIPYMHWGHEGEPEPSERQKTFSRQMIDAGASVVIGAHPHIVQGTDVYQDRLIAYSLGNFVFDDFEDPSAFLGWVLRMRFDREGLVNWETHIARIDQQGIPHLDKVSKGPAGEREKKAK